MRADLARSPFRSRFKITEKERIYTARKGIETIRSQAAKIISERLAAALPLNDGAQTPMRGHVVFKAQHATATCCRSCLEKWHHIPKGRPLTEEEQEQIVSMIADWIMAQCGDLSGYYREQDLFEKSTKKAPAENRNGSMPGL